MVLYIPWDVPWQLLTRYEMPHNNVYGIVNDPWDVVHVPTGVLWSFLLCTIAQYTIGMVHGMSHRMPRDIYIYP